MRDKAEKNIKPDNHDGECIKLSHRTNTRYPGRTDRWESCGVILYSYGHCDISPGHYENLVALPTE